MGQLDEIFKEARLKGEQEKEESPPVEGQSSGGSESDDNIMATGPPKNINKIKSMSNSVDINLNRIPEHEEQDEEEEEEDRDDTEIEYKDESEDDENNNPSSNDDVEIDYLKLLMDHI